MDKQGIFPWSRGVPYEWCLWFAWYPVRLRTKRIAFLRLVYAQSHAYIAPNGDLADSYEYKGLSDG